MDWISALRERAEQAEVYSVTRESTEISFEANEIKSAKTEETQGIALRAVVDGRLGFTAASGRVVEEDLIENLMASAQFGDRVPLQLPPPTEGPRIEIYDPSLAEVPLDRLVDIGREIVDRLLQVDADAKIDVDIERGVHHTRLRNSAGADTTEQGSSLSIAASVERVRGDDVLVTYDGVSGIGLTDDYQDLIERMATKIELAKRAATIGSARMPVLFAPKGCMVLALPMMRAINGQNVQRGTSPLSDRLGDGVFDAKLSVWDDPLIPGRPNSGSHDAEGVSCYRKAPILRGTCQTFLYDLRTAALMETESTGNGARSLFSTPSPSPTNLVIEAGETPVAEMIAGIDHGLLVEDVLGLGQGNPISGAFSNTLGLAFAIEQGEIVGRVKDVSIAGNIYRDLQEIAGLSKESQWVYGRLKLPYLLLSDLNVTAKT